MKIRTILKSKGEQSHTVSPQTTLKDMVARMVELGIGSLLVTDAAAHVVGIVTERDLLKNLVRLGVEWEQAKVSDLMTRDLVTATPEDELDRVMTLMTERRIRHLPVMDGDRIAGVLSMRDVIEAMLNESKFQNTLMKRYIKDWPEGD